MPESCRNREAGLPRFAPGTPIWPTSNISERGVRPLKAQQKISGRLTSDDVTQNRLDIPGYTGADRDDRAGREHGQVVGAQQDHVGVRLMRHARADVVAFERAVVQLREVVYSHHVTGNSDYLLQVEVADLPAYEDFHATRLAALPSVAAVTSYVTMKTLSTETA